MKNTLHFLYLLPNRSYLESHTPKKSDEKHNLLVSFRSESQGQITQSHTAVAEGLFSTFPLQQNPSHI